MTSLRLRYAAGAGAGLLAKMLAILFFAWRFSPESYALLVQVQAQTSLWVLIAGFDLYVFFHRRWVQQGYSIPRDELGWFVVAISLGYAIVGPAVLALSGLGPSHTLLLLTVILTEHLSQELNRVLLAFERHMQAMVVQLLRNLLWVVVFVALSLSTRFQDPLAAFLSLWACGGAMAIVAGYMFMRPLTSPPSGAAVAPLFSSAAATLLPSLLATLAARFMLSADRLVAAATLPAVEVAAYGMYVTIGAGALAVADISVIAFFQPRVLRVLNADATSDAFQAARAQMRRAMLQVLVVNVLVSAGGWGFVVVALAPPFAASPMAFVAVQCAYLFYALTHASDAILYATGRFTTNLATVAASSAILGGLLIALTSLGCGLLALSLATASSFLALLLMKLSVAKRSLVRGLHRPGCTA